MTKSDNSSTSEKDAFGRDFQLKTGLKQRDIAAWNRSYIAHKSRAAVADERQAALEAAIEAGWIVTPPTSWEQVIDPVSGTTSSRYYFDGVQVDDLLASEVAYYGLQCSRLFDTEMSIPKATSSR